MKDSGNNAVRGGHAAEAWLCHTALIQGYVIEGHVPASDILRLLKIAQSLGLRCPRYAGRITGNGRTDPWRTPRPLRGLLVLKDGSSKVFNTYS